MENNTMTSKATGNLKMHEEYLTFTEEEIILYEEKNELDDEIKEKNIDILADRWVREWNDQKERNIRDKERDETRKYIRESLDRSYDDEPTVSKLRNEKPKKVLYIRYIAAVAAILAGVIFLSRLFVKQDNPESLFSQFYKPYNVILPQTRGENNSDNSLSAGIISYRQGNFVKASLAFSDVLSNDRSNAEALFFLGITDIALGKYAEATDVLNHGGLINGKYSKEVAWYLGLACLRTGNREAAIHNFSQLSQSPGYYRKSAGKILRRLTK